MMPKLAVLLVVMVGLDGCGVRDCLIGVAQRDCYAEGSPRATFPQDDATCRNYGLTPGTHDYAVCRQAKANERRRTERETDFGFLKNPLAPNLR